MIKNRSTAGPFAFRPALARRLLPRALSTRPADPRRTA
jgi:hypothetical protein